MPQQAVANGIGHRDDRRAQFTTRFNWVVSTLSGSCCVSIAYVLAGLLAFVLIITIPFGIAAFRIAGYVLWPFGRTIDRRPEAGVASVIGNVLWIVFFGWWLAVGHLVSGVLLCLTIIGIPLGLASFKIIPITLVPLGVRIVPVDSVYAEAA